MGVVSFTNFLFRLFGFPGSSRPVVTKIIQTSILLIDALVFARFAIYYCLTAHRLSSISRAIHYSSHLFIPCHAALYWWRIRTPSIRKTEPRNLGCTFRLISIVLILISLLSFFVLIYALSVFPGIMGGSSGVPFIDFFMVNAKLPLPLVHLQGHLIYLDIGFTLRSFAEHIENLADSLRSDSAIIITREVESKCAELSDILWRPLHLVHVFYFLRLIFELPVHCSISICGGGVLPPIILGASTLFDYLVIAAPANSIVQHSRVIVQKIRCRRLFYEASIEEIRFFTMTEHGISLFFGAILDWKFCCSFLALCWGFSLTAMQTFFESIDCEDLGVR